MEIYKKELREINFDHELEGDINVAPNLPVLSPEQEETFKQYQKK